MSGALKVRDVVQRLQTASTSGELGALCDRYCVELMVLFGSAARDPAAAADIDLAVRHASPQADPLGLLQGLYELTCYEGFDLLDLGRAGPLARERALVGGRLLHEANAGVFANAQIAAIMERMDTDEMRRVELELMAR